MLASPREEAALDAFVELEHLMNGDGGSALKNMTFKKAMFSSPAACMKGMEIRRRKLENNHTAPAMREKRQLISCIMRSPELNRRTLPVICIF